MDALNTKHGSQTSGDSVEAILLENMTPKHGNHWDQHPPYSGQHDDISPSTEDGNHRDKSGCRKLASLSTLGQTALDLCLALLPFYFLAFAIQASRQAGERVEADAPVALLRAALIGPTILPIVFAAIVGRCLTSFAAWKLEHGVSVALVEYLVGSRTIFGVISTPIRLRFLHYGIPLLFILWALSPLGGQASLRVVSPGPFRQESSGTVYYLNTSSGFLVQGASTLYSHGPAVNAAFLTALGSPPSSKANARDHYGYAKVPLLEDASTRHTQPDNDGWYSVSESNIEYSSIIGLPSSGVGSRGKTSFNLETSYLYPNCTLDLQPLISIVDGKARNTSYHYEYERFRDNTTCNNGNYSGLAMQLREDIADRSLNRSAWGTTQVRSVKLTSWGSSGDISYATVATCDVTTTRVEVRYECVDGSCASTAIRQSKLLYDFPAGTVQLDFTTGGATMSMRICEQLVNATRWLDTFTTSPLEFYLFDPDYPLLVRFDRPILAEVGETAFSQRFAQLLNTLWVAGIAPDAINGNFTVTPSAFGYGVSNTTANFATEDTVLICNKQWLAVLILSSTAMCAAGIATVFLNLARKGPEVLDNFTTMLRDNPYIETQTGPSMEDGPDKARRLRKMRVVLGDVRPSEAVGHVALATRTVDQPVDYLRARRSYK